MKTTNNMKWIDIKERRPEFDTLVLVCDKEQKESIIIAQLKNVIETKNDVSFNFQEGETRYEYLCKVTHWMPLPELPQ
jgi:hypothetical protein